MLSFYSHQPIFTIKTDYYLSIKHVYFCVFQSNDSKETIIFLILGLTLFRMDLFGAAHRWPGRPKRSPDIPKVCYKYPTMIKLCTVISHLSKIQKIANSGDTPLEFC